MLSVIVGSVTSVVFVQVALNKSSASGTGAVSQMASLLKVKNAAIVAKEWDAEATSSVMEVYAVPPTGLPNGQRHKNEENDFYIL